LVARFRTLSIAQNDRSIVGRISGRERKGSQEATVILDLHPALAELLEVGRQRGWLSYEEMNNTLPDEWVDPERLHELLVLIDERGIELIDEPEYRARCFREARKRGVTTESITGEGNGVVTPPRASTSRPSASSPAATCGWSSRSPRSTATAGCRSWTSSRRATPA
jgi:hypothetical protein